MKKQIISFIPEWFKYTYRLLRFQLAKSSKGLVYDPIFPSAEGVFWGGYHDVNLERNGKLLTHRLESTKDWTLKAYDKHVSICQYDLETQNLVEVANTRLWSFQQGARLRWYDDKKIIFNGHYDNEPSTLICDIEDNVISKFNSDPYYDIAGNHLTFVNYEYIFSQRPGYGYYNYKSQNIDQTNLWIANNMDRRPAIAASEAEIRSSLNLRDSYYVNHPVLNEDGTLVFFLVIVEGEKRKAIGMVYNIENRELIKVFHERFVSHFVWISKNELFLTTYNSDGIWKAFEVFISESEVKYMGIDEINFDCHPCVNPVNINMLCLDTYPDNKGLQDVFLFDRKSKKLRRIKRFFAPFRYRGEVRCDLHCRFDSLGSNIYADFTSLGSRNIARISND